MRLSLLRAKEILKPKARAGQLEHRLNRVCERLILHGKFIGSIVKLDILARYGQLTPPRWIRAVEGVRVNNHVRQLANRWFEWIPGRCSAEGYCLDLVRDLGDGHPTIADLPTGGSLVSVVPSGTHIITVYGRDANGLPHVAPISANQTIPNPFSAITRVHKEQTDVAITLKHVATDLTETLLAPMELLEEETFYHRYAIDGKATEAETLVTAICKLRHLEFTNDQDVLPFSNISALELGLDALQFEAENDHATADKYLFKAVDLLNRELADSNSDNSIPKIQFRWIGGAPRLHHGY